jgi:cytochrome c-type biogenesis protein CcmH
MNKNPSSRRKPGPIRSQRNPVSGLRRMIADTFTIAWIPAFAGMTMIVLLSSFAFAGSLPQDRLLNPVLESRAENLFSQLRCLVCQNETIADSDARIAHDLRLLVRTRLTAGDTDTQIMDYIHSRYGDFVLMKPPLKPSTWLLWFGPFIILLAGIATIFHILRRQKGPS